MDVVNAYKEKGHKIYVAGQPRVLNEYYESTNENLSKLTLLTILIIAFALIYLFRRASGVFIPFANVTLALISTFGLMGLLSVKITVVTQVLSSFILAVGIGDSVHILSKFYKYMEEGKDKKTAIIDAFKGSGLAIVMTSLTTAAGLLSFLTAGSPPVNELGVFAAYGVMMSLGFTFIFTPAIVRVLRFKAVKAKKEKKTPVIDRFLNACADLSTKKPLLVLSVSFILAIISLISISQLKIEQNMIEAFSKNTELRQDADILSPSLASEVSVELIIDSKRKDGVKDPKFLQKSQN